LQLLLADVRATRLAASQFIQDEINQRSRPLPSGQLSTWRCAPARAQWRHKSAKAVTSDALPSLLSTCERNSLRDQRDRAVLMVAFASGASA